MDYLHYIIIIMLILIFIAVIIIIFYIVEIKDELKKEKEVLFIESSVITLIDQSEEYIQLFSYDNRFNKKTGHHSEYIIKFKNASSQNSIILKVQDELGNELGGEVYISQEKPYSIPFTYRGNEDFFNLMVKSDTENIELQRIEILFTKKIKI